MSVCCHCSCACHTPNASEKPADVSEELDEAAHVIADAIGEKVYYSKRGTFGGSRVYIGSGGAKEIPMPGVPSERGYGCYMRTVKIDDADHMRDYIKVSFEVHWMPVETAEALFRWLYGRE